MDHTTAAIDLKDLHTVETLAGENAQILNVQMLRWQLRHRDRNGLANACIRIGKKLLISKSRYEQWLASQVGK